MPAAVLPSPFGSSRTVRGIDVWVNCASRILFDLMFRLGLTRDVSLFIVWVNMHVLFD